MAKCDKDDKNTICEEDCDKGPLEVFEFTLYHKCLSAC